jgi:hypothetical protein
LRHQPVRVINRQWHELRRFVAGIAVHQALVAGALIKIKALAFINALRDVDRLRIECGQHRATAMVKTECGIIVADAFDDVARKFGEIDSAFGLVVGDLPRHDDESRRHQRFGSHTAVFVLC